MPSDGVERGLYDRNPKWDCVADDELPPADVTIDPATGSDWDVVVSDDEMRMFEYRGPVHDLGEVR